jgi:hypothetical protein
MEKTDRAAKIAAALLSERHKSTRANGGANGNGHKTPVRKPGKRVVTIEV